jgi:hypothetical protein
MVGHATDVPSERDLKCGSGVDDRAPVGVASVRRSCVTAQNFFEGWLLAITDEPESVSPFLSAKWADVRRSNRDAYSAVVGWLDEREPDADQFGVIDAVIWVEILAGHYLNPGAHIVEPSVDVPGELIVRGEPRPVIVVDWAIDVGHGHAMKRGRRPKRLRNERAIVHGERKIIRQAFPTADPGAPAAPPSGRQIAAGHLFQILR